MIEKFKPILEVKPISDIESRQEVRYASIGIPLLYSATSHTYTKDLGQKLLHAATIDMSLSGLAFDVNVKMHKGDKIVLFVEKPETNNYEELSTIVRWCRTLSENKYRIGVTIDMAASQKMLYKSTPLEFIPQFDMPQEIETRCPACKISSVFHFVVYQPVLLGIGLMPLYDCSVCGTTRSLQGLLNMN